MGKLCLHSTSLPAKNLRKTQAKSLPNTLVTVSQIV